MIDNTADLFFMLGTVVALAGGAGMIISVRQRDNRPFWRSAAWAYLGLALMLVAVVLYLKQNLEL